MPEKLEYTKLEGETVPYLEKYFVSKFRTGYVKCKGTVVPEYYKNFGDKIMELEIRDNDTWVCSFPKSGTTWTQEMVWCIANDLDFEAAKEFLPRRFPFLEHSLLFDYRDLITRRPDIEFPSYVLNSVDVLNEKSSPRFIKTHLPFPLLPEQLQRNQTSAKIVYVARNPRDTCISYYHHCALLEGYKGTFERFCDLFLEGNLSFAPFWHHVLSFWEQRNNPNVLILRYEDMKNDLRSVIYKTANFLGKSLTEEQVEKLQDHLSFQSMKENRAVNYEAVIEINKKYNLIEQDGSFMRRGQIGEWKEKMDSSLTERFQSWEKEHLAKTDFSFKY